MEENKQQNSARIVTGALYELWEMTADLVLQVVGICSCSTLCSHEVGKVPDEFTDNVLLPLLVEHVVVALQNYLLVLLSKHHGRILQGEKRAS